MLLLRHSLKEPQLVTIRSYYTRLDKRRRRNRKSKRRFETIASMIFPETVNLISTNLHTYNIYIFLRTLIAQGGGPSTGQRGGFLRACSRP